MAIWWHGAIASHKARASAAQRARAGLRSRLVRGGHRAGQAAARRVGALSYHATAQPVADALGLSIDIDDRLAEYDRDMEHYIPIEQIAAEFPEELARLASGHLPSSVDEKAFLERINAGINELATVGDHDGTVAVFTHGGVINGLLHSILGTEKLLCVNVDYAGVTRLLSSRDGNLYVAAVNGTEHVWDLLPRNARW